MVHITCVGVCKQGQVQKLNGATAFSWKEFKKCPEPRSTRSAFFSRLQFVSTFLFATSSKIVVKVLNTEQLRLSSHECLLLQETKIINYNAFSVKTNNKKVSPEGKPQLSFFGILEHKIYLNDFNLQFYTKSL